MRRVVITGMGLAVGDLSEGQETFAEKCFTGQSFIRKCQSFDTAGLATDKFGETEGLPGEKPELNARFLALEQRAIADLLQDAQISREEISAWGRKCRLIIGTLIFASEAFYRHSKAQRAGMTDNYIAHVNDYSALAKKLSGVKGSCTVISASCASGTTAAGMALDYIRNGLCDAAVLGGVDSLSIITAYGFNALKSLSHSVCSPFDQQRDGISIGEGSAFFLVEEREHALARGAKILGELVGYGLGNDAYHITSPQPEGEGACRVMQAALKDAGLSPEAIGYINAHGTGTPINDAMETKAIEQVFGEVKHTIHLSSTKALLGHAMGASGALELASTVLALNKRRCIPMPGLQKPLDIKGHIKISDKPAAMEAEYAIKNSFAFGGNGAALVIKRGEGDEA